MNNIKIFHKGHSTYLNPKEVLFLQAESNYTSIVTASGEKYLVPKCLKSYTKIIDTYNYVRIHAKYMVNMDYTKMISVKDRSLTLNVGSITLPIARARLKSVIG